MTLRNDALPHAHHVDLVQDVAEDLRRNLARLGMMRALTVVRLGASGAYRIDAVPAADVRLSFMLDLGVGPAEAIALLDDLLTYQPQTEAAVLVHETNPVDGALLTFLVQELGFVR